MSKKVNIYYSGFLSRVGGAYYHAVNLSKGLKEQGYEVKILTFDDLPLILRYIPHLLQFAINKICFPLGYIYKDSVINANPMTYFALINLQQDLENKMDEASLSEQRHLTVPFVKQVMGTI